jgi:hypothetical protein
MHTINRPLLFAFLTASAIVFIGSLPPIGVHWYTSQIGAVGHNAPLWDAVLQMPAVARECRSTHEFLGLEQENIAKASFFVLLAAGAGWAVYRITCRRERPPEVDDYQDGPGETSDWQVKAP